MGLKIQDYQGDQLAPYIDHLARLRIEVFFDFPYLYQGTLAYEQSYLRTYVNSEKAQVTLAWDGNRCVGATTCLPLVDEVESLTQPLVRAGFSLGSAFYFGESILLPDYRGKGLGREFFKRRHEHAQKTFADLSFTVFCSVDRAVSHPMRPDNYRPLHDFWRSEGYRPLTGFKAELSWLDRGDTHESAKKLTYWLKDFQF